MRAAIAAAAMAAAALAAAEATGDAARGREVYNRHCYFCHGYSGDARTVAASVLSPPPRDFTAQALDAQRMLDAVRNGRPGTAMQPFSGTLGEPDIDAVVAFVREAFMIRGEQNLRYHSPVNGWTGDPRSSPAAPFVTGALAPRARAPTPELDRGRALYLSACITCHTRGPGEGQGPAWRNEAVTFPVGNYLEHEHGHPDPVTDVFERHEQPPALAAADAGLRQGEALYQGNCAHCHAADGTGRHWIGSFLEPPPPDFTREGAPAADGDLERAIAAGSPGTSMPAWRDVLDAAQIAAVARYMRAVFPRYARR